MLVYYSNDKSLVMIFEIIKRTVSLKYGWKIMQSYSFDMISTFFFGGKGKYIEFRWPFLQEYNRNYYQQEQLEIPYKVGIKSTIRPGKTIKSGFPTSPKRILIGLSGPCKNMISGHP